MDKTPAKLAAEAFKEAYWNIDDAPLLTAAVEAGVRAAFRALAAMEPTPSMAKAATIKAYYVVAEEAFKVGQIYAAVASAEEGAE
jgi:hypothetical protein